MNRAEGKTSTRASPDGAHDGEQASAGKAARSAPDDALARRLQAMIGRESVSSFARRCGLAESVLRTYLRDGRMPPLDKAREMATAAGVSLDWFAGGLGPPAAAEGLASYRIERSAAMGSGGPDPTRLEAAIAQALAQLGGAASPADLAAQAVGFYERLGKATGP